MIDTGLLLSMIAVVSVPRLLSQFVRLASIPRKAVLEVATGPVMVGLLVGRLSAMALDNPTGLVRVQDLLVIRSGVEFWPGVAAGVLVAAWGARRRHVNVLRRLADLAPFGLVAYAAYEAACLVREGCYGPRSAVGFVPDGLRTRMLPLGILVAAFAALLAFILYRISWMPSLATVLLAIGGLALARGLVSFWLPRVGQQLSRQHVTSLAVSAAAGLGLMVIGAQAVRRGHFR